MKAYNYRNHLYFDHKSRNEKLIFKNTKQKIHMLIKFKELKN